MRTGMVMESLMTKIVSHLDGKAALNYIMASILISGGKELT